MLQNVCFDPSLSTDPRKRRRKDRNCVIPLYTYCVHTVPNVASLVLELLPGPFFFVPCRWRAQTAEMQWIILGRQWLKIQNTLRFCAVGQEHSCQRSKRERLQSL